MIRAIFGVLGWLLKQIGGLFRFWPLVLIAVFFISPVGPHLRWEYTYTDVYGRRVFHACTYLGARGFIITDGYPDCPFVAVLDTRTGRR